MGRIASDGHHYVPFGSRRQVQQPIGSRFCWTDERKTCLGSHVRIESPFLPNQAAPIDLQRRPPT